MKSNRFLLAAFLSCVLHLAVGAVLLKGGHSLQKGARTVSTDTVAYTRLDEATGPFESAVLPVEVEPIAPPPVKGPEIAAEPRSEAEAKATVAVSPKATLTPPVLKDVEQGVNRAISQERPAKLARLDGSIAKDGRTREDADRERARSQSRDQDVTAVPVAAPSVSHDALRQAMQSAASQTNQGTARFTQPMIRVDPREKNLDRAWSRAFAWAFATDASFFSAAPIGRARFTIELADDGRIREVRWAQPAAPLRLKDLVLRMIKLLAINHFSPPNPDGDRSGQRGFEMIVSESHVALPKQESPVDVQSGDIWMMGAGETPTLGHPSNPSVADMTGHKISCLLKILEPPPTLP